MSRIGDDHFSSQVSTTKTSLEIVILVILLASGQRRLNRDPEMAEDAKDLPKYFWEAAPESMRLFLSEVNREYGSIRGYLEIHGAEVSLFNRLEQALLT
jgi:hypothetical protein